MSSRIIKVHRNEFSFLSPLEHYLLCNVQTLNVSARLGNIESQIDCLFCMLNPKHLNIMLDLIYGYLNFKNDLNFRFFGNLISWNKDRQRNISHNKSKVLILCHRKFQEVEILNCFSSYKIFIKNVLSYVITLTT